MQHKVPVEGSETHSDRAAFPSFCGSRPGSTEGARTRSRRSAPPCAADVPASAGGKYQGCLVPGREPTPPPLPHLTASGRRDWRLARYIVRDQRESSTFRSAIGDLTVSSHDPGRRDADGKASTSSMCGAGDAHTEWARGSAFSAPIRAGRVRRRCPARTSTTRVSTGRGPGRRQCAAVIIGARVWPVRSAAVPQGGKIGDHTALAAGPVVKAASIRAYGGRQSCPPGHLGSA